MKRMMIGLLFWGLAQSASAGSISDQVIANLKAQGFIVVQMDRTWLGRIWLIARSNSVQREIVFNPTTGEILRDYAVSLVASGSAGGGAEQTASTSGADSSGDVTLGSSTDVPSATVADVPNNPVVALPSVDPVLTLDGSPAP